MAMGWIGSRRAVFSKYLTPILLVSVLAASLHTFYASSTSDSHASYYQVDPDSLFDVVLYFDGETELHTGSNFPGNSVELNSELNPASDVKSKTGNGKATSQNRPLGAHTLTPDGLLIVNPDGPHPIFQLIHDAEVAWEEKLARASKTLEEAVEEYKRRYCRAPPLGFDKWWAYVVKHRVQLPDEYDEIFEDIEPFWGIDPADLARTQEKLEKERGVVTVQKTEGHPRIEIVQSTLPPDRVHLRGSVERLFKVVRELEEDLPPLRITVSPFDNPGMLSNWQIKNMAREAAAKGSTLKSADLPKIEKHGWIEACPPDSPARLNPPILPPPSAAPLLPSSMNKTFIASHRDTMNPCTNPSLLVTHGQFLSHNVGPFPQRTLVPRFSLCATQLHHDIRPPVPYGWKFEADSDPYAEAENGDNIEEQGAFEGDLPWKHKGDTRLNWRGRTTGMYVTQESLWQHAQRSRFVTLTNALEGNVSVLSVPTDAGKTRAETVPVGEPESMWLSEVNSEWIDVGFADKPVSCDQEAGMCDEMKTVWEFKQLQEAWKEGQYKFIFDIDGNGWSGRFKRLMTSNALIFKATIYPEWYTSRIAPWVHYVPIQVSYVDLYDAVAFFRAHDELAARIAKAGREWSRRFWRREDMAAYMYRLLLEYARVTSLDRASMDYVA